MRAELGPEDLNAARQITTVLLHPDAATEGGRRRVLDRTSRLLGADQSTLLLPENGEPRWEAFGFDASVLSEYPKEMSRMDERLRPWARHVREGAFNRTTIWHPDEDLYYSSAYYNEFILEHRFHDSVGVAVGLGGEPSPRTIAKMVLTRERPGSTFMWTGLEVMRLIRPAFETFVRTWLSRTRHFADLEHRPDGYALFTASGRLLHVTARLEVALRTCGDAGALLDAARAAARAMFASLDSAAQALPRPTERVMIGRRCHVLRCTLVPEGWLASEPVAAVSVEAPAPGDATAAALVSRYALTRREAEVALLLGEEGLSNAGIAARLGISVHTVRHHVERVLAKLGARHRAQVAPRITWARAGDPTRGGSAD